MSSQSPDQSFHDLIRASLCAGDLDDALRYTYQWLHHFAAHLPGEPAKSDLANPKLWSAVADVVERTSDHHLIESLWQILDSVSIKQQPTTSIPLLGIPILNRVDLLSRLLDSLDHPVECLAIVDNSRLAASESQVGRGSTASGAAEAASVSGDQPADVQNHETVARYLRSLQQLGHPLIDEIHIATPFRNMGVAASWNHILSSFPEKTLCLLANNDIIFPAGVLKSTLKKMDPSKPQFLPLLPVPNSFSAFMLTSLCWDRIGLFDTGFYPAYFEDLEFRDRIRSEPSIQQISDESIQHVMLEANPSHSSTIASSARLQELNRTSYALNKLWYLSPRRLRHDRRGSWRRLWLSQWTD